MIRTVFDRFFLWTFAENEAIDSFFSRSPRDTVTEIPTKKFKKNSIINVGVVLWLNILSVSFDRLHHRRCFLTWHAARFMSCPCVGGEYGIIKIKLGILPLHNQHTVCSTAHCGTEKTHSKSHTQYMYQLPGGPAPLARTGRLQTLGSLICRRGRRLNWACTSRCDLGASDTF